jgi:putative ABC transport system ATP-binding protein
VPGTPTIQLRQLVLRFGDRVVLDHVDLEVFPGEVVAIVGVSGAGKSSLLMCASGLMAADTGDVVIDGTELSALRGRARDRVRARRLGFVYQSGELVPELTLAENVALPLRLAGVPKSAAVESAGTWLGRLGIDRLAARMPTQVSGGEMQRAAIARAMVHAPVAILADEPTGALDDHNGSVVFDLLAKSVRSAQASAVVVTHDASLAARADRSLRLSNGRLSPC